MEVTKLFVVYHFKVPKEVFRYKNDAEEYSRYWNESYILGPYYVIEEFALLDGNGNCFLLGKGFILNEEALNLR
jgi:hypothetical protein